MRCSPTSSPTCGGSTTSSTECPRWIAGVVAVVLMLGGGTHFTMAQSTADTAPYTLARVERLASARARRDAVKHLRHSHDPSALATLVGIARSDADEDVQ